MKFIAGTRFSEGKSSLPQKTLKGKVTSKTFKPKRVIEQISKAVYIINKCNHCTA